MISTDSEIEYLIIGAGIFGTSTAYHLAKQVPPSSITIVDRHDFPSPSADSDNAPYGASHDINKIVRADYSNTFYMQLAQEAIEAWQAWDVISKYYHRTGWVMMDEADSTLAQRIRQNFQTCSVKDETRDMSFDEVRSSWNEILKDVDTRGFGSAYWNPGAGWAEADRAVEAMLGEAVKMGVSYKQGQVIDFCVRESIFNAAVSGVELVDGTKLSAKRIILATGAWTAHLMSNLESRINIEAKSSIESQLKAAGVTVVHFELDEPEMTRYEKMPVIVYGGNGEVLPPPPSRLLKFTNAASFTNNVPLPQQESVSSKGQENVRFISVPAESQREVPETLKNETLDIVKRIAPSFLSSAPRVAFWRLCWDAITPEQHQLITKHPDGRLSNLFFAVGGSFHSWKFLPTIGKYAANVVQGISNGQEKDDKWAWKKEGWEEGGKNGAHEKVILRRDLKDLL